MDKLSFEDFQETYVVLNLRHLPATEIDILRKIIEAEDVIGSLEPVRINLWCGEFRELTTDVPTVKFIAKKAYDNGVDYLAFDDAPDLHPALVEYRGTDD